MDVTTNQISVEKTKNTKINDVDFNNLSFGSIYMDHMLVCDYKNGAWEAPKVVPYQPISLDPSAKIFHYGQSIFEGMKAYKDEQDTIWMFRPLDNHKRLNLSAKRLAIPEIPENYFMEGLKALLKTDSDWIPQSPGSSLYIRPFIFATGLGFHASPADEYKFVICGAPSGSYFSGEVKVLIEETYSRSANGGVGFAKAGGNYAGQFYPTKLAQDKGYQQVIWTDDNTHEYIEEAGAMNVFVRINDTLLTCPTSDRILDGITRKSILKIAEDEGIKTEVRKIKVQELVDAAKDGSLKEMFGAGTAAVISPIAGFGFRDNDYMLPTNLENSYATLLKDRITSIQYNKAEDKFGWRFKVE
ncbi:MULTISPECIES: branched-chain amino acid aminotransferase [Cellulophaga]|uniref:Branched-chain-amino-acid aminotransferase n=2 Tax=Cellulophaga TaxID=104264 RepID=F0RHR3_CELLC|nr:MULTISPECIES: branched-chain amino acid aminotransferase [Cellulophaga]ADY28172.1 branched-chain amino acid aminotransferase [Cellulophaga lytica DSM 7489]APU09061.1 branched chain amino acid aminotransferase [Cellulophaga lytica]EWH12747.1 branched-chain amino acid aminotransferase [Cellulophaga geojensis KL-A]MDO6853648.1 branched-chain amino acid aminotransferase [Cellulophaga lytica]TVZ09258.1 branched-chain amino acid aminotransferase [Cellulophaga sp. RHA_52]